jgi:DNA replication protein DnaC
MNKMNVYENIMHGMKVYDDGDKQITNDFPQIEDATRYWDDYEQNNPNILKRVTSDISGGKPFHYLFTGCVGAGKTYTAKKIVNSIKGKWEFINVKSHYENHLRYIQSNFDDKWDAIKRHGNKFKSKCMMLDDLGDERPSTAAAHDYFAGCMEVRYIYIQKNPMSRTIITTNLSADGINSMYGSRVLDRLQEHFVICRFKEVSFRSKQQQIVNS